MYILVHESEFFKLYFRLQIIELQIYKIKATERKGFRISKILLSTETSDDLYTITVLATHCMRMWEKYLRIVVYIYSIVGAFDKIFHHFLWITITVCVLRIKKAEMVGMVADPKKTKVKKAWASSTWAFLEVIYFRFDPGF